MTARVRRKLLIKCVLRVVAMLVSKATNFLNSKMYKECIAECISNGFLTFFYVITQYFKNNPCTIESYIS